MPDVNVYHVLGLMSGSSLDGLDIVYAQIKTGDQFAFEIIRGETAAYYPEIKNYLAAIDTSKKDFTQEDNYFAGIVSDAILQFVNKYGITRIDFIASHGHTILHHPEKKITCQIGNGKLIAAQTGFHVICNFRQKDIDAGGQGAPLVPICDELFFHEYHACLNIGGIANISFTENNRRIGFDICGANQLLNYFAGELNLNYDANGDLARSGKVNQDLLLLLNDHPYFKMPAPKSLDNQFVKNEFINPIIAASLSTVDKLATATHHIAQQISQVIRSQIQLENIPPEKYRLLVTGGGAYNSFLVSLFEQSAGITIRLPSKQIIELKEALAMCLMGVLRWENKRNFLPSVTGAKYAVSGGDIYLHQS